MANNRATVFTDTSSKTDISVEHELPLRSIAFWIKVGYNKITPQTSILTAYIMSWPVSVISDWDQ